MRGSEDCKCWQFLFLLSSVRGSHKENERHHELRFHVLSTFILPRSTYVPFTLGDMLPANLLHDDLQTGKHAGL